MTADRMGGTAGLGLAITGWLFLIGWGMQTASCADDQFPFCPDESGSFYSTSPDCLIYYQCANNMVWTKVCFPWQRFDVHQMQCRDFTEVDCNPEFTGIWRPTYGEAAEPVVSEGELTIGEIPAQTESVTEDQLFQETEATEVEGGNRVDNLSLEEGEGDGNMEIINVETREKENNFKILSTIENLDPAENQQSESKYNLLEIEKIQEENIDYKFLFREENIPLGSSIHKAKRYVPDDYPLSSDGTAITNSKDSLQEGKPKKMLKNVLLMNVDDQSLNQVLNWFASNQMQTTNNRDPGGFPPTAVGDTLSFDMNCGRPVNTAPTRPTNQGGGRPNGQGSNGRPTRRTTTPPSLNNQGSGDNGFWYWCGSGRFVYTQTNTQGDRLCQQLQDPQFINQEGGGNQQGGDWAGHTFIG